MTNFKKLFLFLINIVPLGLVAQLSFEEIEITKRDDVIFRPKLLEYENLDLDQDGNFDVLVHSRFTIVWYDNRDGSGDYSSANMIYNSGSVIIRDVKIEDLDNDGDLDLLCVVDGSRGGDVLGWISNQEGGKFSDFKIIDENLSNSNRSEIKDIDGDNDNDLLFDTPEGVIWYENIDSLGIFANSKLIISRNGFFHRNSFMVEDVNGDSKIDIVLNTTGELNQISWYENLGNMSFSSALPFHENTRFAPRLLKKVNIDSDVNADFIASYGNNFIWYEFDQIGELSRTNINIGDLGASSIGLSLIATDIDSDGDQDMLYTIGDSIHWLENNDGKGTFSAPNTIETDGQFCSSSCSNPEAKLATGDIDGNGTIDIIATFRSFAVGEIHKYSNLDGQGTFSSRNIISEYLYSRELESIDVDNDGDLDILSKNILHTSIYKNLDGKGNFGRQESISETDFLIDSEPIDVDNDGDFDIISITNAPNNLVWYENINSSGKFKKAKIINTSLELDSGSSDDLQNIAVGDIDKDGFQDIVIVLDKTIETVYWLKNENGSGAFSEPIKISNNVEQPNIVELGDLNGDDDLDVVLLEGNFFNKHIKYYENEEGSFSSKVVFPDDPDIRGFRLADLDQDSDLDLITFGKNIKWFENIDGNGNFSSSMLIGNPSEFIQFIEIVDLDGDFDNDIVWKSFKKKGIFWYENLNGNEDFSDEISIFISERTEPNPVTAIGDFNGDSKVDIANSDAFEYEAFGSTHLPNRLILLLNQGDSSLSISTHHLETSVCNMYPVPLKNNLNINCIKNIILKLELFNIEGKLLISSTLSEEDNILDVSNLTQGLYIIKLKDRSGNTTVQKVIK